MPSPKKPQKKKEALAPQETLNESNSEESNISQEESYTVDKEPKRNESPKSLKSSRSTKSKSASPWDSTKKNEKAKSTQDKGTPPIDSTEKSSYGKQLLACVVLIIAVIFALYRNDPNFLQFGTHKNSKNNSSTDTLVKIKEDFKKYISDLQGIFTAQDKDFWKKIKVPVLRVIKEEEPDYPAVLLLVVPKGESTSQTATCLAKKYRSNLSKLYKGSGNINEAYIDAQTLSSSGSVENIKYDLDNKIKELLDSKNTELPTMVIDHIEALDPNVMLLFHGYCDGDYAPHKKALILFVLHTNLDSKEFKNLDRTVDGLLQSLWGKNLDADKIPPLIARIANNKAMIHEEKMSSLANSGC